MRLRVLRVGIMNVICSDQWNVQLLAHLEQLRIHQPLLRDSVILQLQKIVSLAEACLVLSRRLPRLFRHPLCDISLYLSGETRGKCDDSLVILIQKLHIHTRFVIIAFRKALAHNLYKVVIAGVVLRQKDEMVISFLAAAYLLVKARVRRNIDLTAEDRLDPRLLRRAVEVNDTVHDAVIRDGGAVHAKLLDSCNIFFYLVGTVQQRVFRVDMQMYKCHVIPHFSRSRKAPPKDRECPFQLLLYYRFFFSKSTLSNASHGREMSSRPK